MSGRSKEFEDAMNQANAAAWDRSWPLAIKEYRRALVEMPDDPLAHAGLAAALETSGELQEALAEYGRVSTLRPGDPVPHSQMARLQEMLGHRQEAVQNYLLLAEVQLECKQLKSALEAWQHVLSLDPDRVSVYDKMITACLRAGQTRAAAKLMSALGQTHYRLKNLPMARLCAQKALTIDPGQPGATALLAAMASGGSESADLHLAPAERGRPLSIAHMAETFVEGGPRWQLETAEPRQPEQVEPITVKGLGDKSQAAAAPAPVTVILQPQPPSGSVLEALRLSETYLMQGLFTAASEEAFSAIELAPDYLPSHIRLAEISEQAGNNNEARAKYFALAETAAAREDIPQSIAFVRRALALNSDDTALRARIVELLVRDGQLREALGEYLELGASLQRAGLFPEATDKYMEGIHLAESAGVSYPAVSELRKRLAECYFRARNWEQTLPLYQKVLQQTPDDDEARLCLAELYLQLGQRESSDRELESLIARRGNAPQASVAVLGTLLRRFPDDVPLNLRLARTYVTAGEPDKAIEVLDELGDRLLNEGRREEAVAVIREIISLGPQQQAAYEQLLKQLTAA